MRKLSIEIKWAVLFVLTTLVWMLGEKLAGLHSKRIDLHATYTLFFAAPAIALYVAALLDKRKNYYGGTMSYKQGLFSGLLITLFVTLMSPITQILVSKVVTPEYFPNAIAYAVSSGAMDQDAAEKYFNLGSYIIQGLIGAPIMGIVTSAIVALFTQKTKNAVREGKVDVVYTDKVKSSRS